MSESDAGQRKYRDDLIRLKLELQLYTGNEVEPSSDGKSLGTLSNLTLSPVLFMNETATVYDIAAHMSAKHVSFVFITSKGSIIGMLTEDILLRQITTLVNTQQLGKSVMGVYPEGIPSLSNTADCLKLLIGNYISAVPITTHSERSIAPKNTIGILELKVCLFKALNGK